MKIDIITLGCSKNLVDSENLMGMFAGTGCTVMHYDDVLPTEEDLAKTHPVVVINTCGFILDAKEESVNTILQFASYKDKGLIQSLFVMGCLSERYRKELTEEIPQVDMFFGKFDWKGVVEEVGEHLDETSTMRCVTTPSHYAYLKISEGCDRKCAYCAIPIMTGNHKSRTEDDILDEVRALVKMGVKELQVIAQELTYYGIDIDGKQHIADLIDKIADVDGVEWIRLHYAYPTRFPMDLLKVMRERKNVCKYLDLPFQHISDNMLSRMHRHNTKEEILTLIGKIRKEVPGIALRTTLMVGFPGETEQDFEELMDFVRTARLECMGAFAYSEEDGTYAAEHYEDDVPDDVKQSRLDRLMALQQKISEEILAEKVGSTMRVIVDSKEGGYYVARSEYSSPEVDPEVLIKDDGSQLMVGEFYDVRIVDACEFDLYAEKIDDNRI